MWKRIYIALAALAVCSACTDEDEVLSERLQGEWTADYFLTEIYDRKTGELWARDLTGSAVGETRFNFSEPNHCDLMWYGRNYGTIGYHISDGWAVFPDPVGKYKVRVGADRMVLRSNEIAHGEYEYSYTIHFLRVGTEVPKSEKSTYSDERLRKMLLGKWRIEMDMLWYSDTRTKAFIYSAAVGMTDETILFRPDGTSLWESKTAHPQSWERTFSIEDGILRFGDNTLEYQIGFAGDELRLFYEYAFDDRSTYDEQRLVRVK